MPSSKKSKEATWTEKELLKAIQQDDSSKRRSDGEKRRSEDKVKKKREGESDKKDSEKKLKHRDKENKDEETHRKHKEREKHKDEDRHRSERKSEDKHRSERKSEGGERHKSERRSDGEKHRSERKSRGEKGDEDKGRKDKSRRAPEADDKEKRKHTEKERSSDKEKDRRRSDKEPSKDSHRSSEKKESRRSKESRKERNDDDDDGDMKFNLNETYDLEALKKHQESKERGGGEKKSSSKSSSSSSKEKVRKLSISYQQASSSSGTKKRTDRKVLASTEKPGSSKVRPERKVLASKEKLESSKIINKVATKVKEEEEKYYYSKKVDSHKEPSIKEEIEEEGDYGYDDDDFEDYDDDDFEDDDGEEDEPEEKGEESGEYSADEEPPTTRNSDNKLSLKSSSSAHEVEELEPDGNNDDRIAPIEADLKTFHHKKKSAHVKLSATRGSAEGKRTQNNDSLDMSEVLKSISAENDRVSSGTSSRNNSRPSTGNDHGTKAADSPKLAKKVFGKINFVAAKQKQLSEKTAKKTKKRGQELLKLVQLDQSFIDLFDMPPMTEYELYMKRFGKSGYTQMYTQTHDDDLTQTTQTDDIETISKWCQCSHDLKSSGTDDDQKSDVSMSGPMNINTARMNEFIVKAGQVMLSLFNELDAGIEQHQRQYTESRTQFSEGYVTLASADFLVLGIADAAAPTNCNEMGRAFTHVTYSPSQTNMLLAAYGDCKLERQLKNAPKGMIAVWNTNDPTRPKAYLLCESLPTSCCFTSSNSLLVFAGMEDGVVAVWDLNEPASYHKESMVGESKEIFRSATFTTAALQENHEYPIVAISPILSAGSSGMSQKKGAMDMSFQLVSLDQSGILNIWIVVEAHVDSTDLSNVHEDLGLSPCGCIKLSRSATMNTLSSIYSSFDSLFSATCFQVDLMKPNDSYVGTDQGIIVHALRFGSRPMPKSYKPSKGSGSKVNAIDVSPWKLPYFLVGYEDGSVSLFHNQKETSLITWESFSKGEAIIDVKWSRSRPGTFFAIDAQSVFYIWDIFQTDIQPVFTQMMMRKDKRAVGFSLANDYAGIGIGTPGRSAEMMLMYGDGSIEIHRLSKTLSVMDADELDRMTEYLDDIIPL